MFWGDNYTIPKNSYPTFMSAPSTSLSFVRPTGTSVNERNDGKNYFIKTDTEISKTNFNLRAQRSGVIMPPPKTETIADKLLCELENCQYQLKKMKEQHFDLIYEMGRLRLAVEQSKYLTPMFGLEHFAMDYEFYQRRCRSNSILIYNVIESPFFAERTIVNAIFYHMGLPTMHVLRTRRVGNQAEFNPRPIVVKLDSHQSMMTVLKAKPKLHSLVSMAMVKIGPDLTPYQRHQLVRMKFLLCEREAAGEVGWYIKFIRGYPALRNARQT